jgi:hypothetical protein
MIKRHPLVIFTLLTFDLTWFVWVPRAAGVPAETEPDVAGHSPTAEQRRLAQRPT